MSIAVLNQVYDETRRLSIAGSQLAVDDFRLKKLVEPLELSAKKAPVFGAVAQAINKLVAGSEKESAQSLLDLASLVLAILYTQGQTGADGKLLPIESKELKLQTTQMSARLLKPLIEALTSTGGGRMETIREAFERGAFDDLRLVNPAIAALDDTYAEIGDFVADRILPRYGQAIASEIRQHLDIKGKGGHARRLRLLYAIDPEGSRPLILDAFENGSREMKIAALGCLGESPEDLPHILEQASAKSKDVRRVALGRLGSFTDEASIALLEQTLKSDDLELATESIRRNSSKRLWETVLATTSAEFAALFAISDKAKLAKALERMFDLLSCYAGRTDKPSLAQLLAIHDRRTELRKLKGTNISGADLMIRLSHLMLLTGDRNFLQRLVVDRENMNDDSFISSFAAAVQSLSPKQVFDFYSPYFIKSETKKRGVFDRPGLMASLLSRDPEYWYRGAGYGLDNEASHEHWASLSANCKWDPRWLDAAIANDNLTCALRFGNPKSAGLKKYLARRYAVELKKGQPDYELYHVLGGMIEMEYPDATDRLIEVFQKLSKSKQQHYYSYWLPPLVSKLPASAASKIEAILPSLPDKFVDEILPHLQTLKAKTK